MVNVGGRSKGCSTCRARKVKCDGNRPMCSRCIKYGALCDGPRDITFVEANIILTRGEKRALRTHSAPSTGGAGKQPHAVSPTSGLRSNEVDLSICYARSHLTRDGPLDLALVRIQPSNLTFAPHQNKACMVQHSAVSFAYLLFGIQHGLTALTVKGYAAHGIALNQINAALSEPDCHLQDDLILSIAALSLLESLVPSGPKNFLNHMLGLQNLLDLRQPGMQCSPMSSILYQAVRHMVLFPSLRNRTPSIFAKLEWKYALDKNPSPYKEAGDNILYDVMADISVMQAESDEVPVQLDAIIDHGMHRREQLESNTYDLLGRLRSWRNDWTPYKPDRYVECPTKHDLSSIGPVPFATMMNFEDRVSALNLMLYNTACIYVFRNLALLMSKDCRSDLPLRQVHNAMTMNKEEVDSAEQAAALEICRCVPSYLSLSTSSALPLEPAFHWTISTAWSSLQGDESPEGLWISNLRRSDGQKLVAQVVLTSA